MAKSKPVPPLPSAPSETSGSGREVSAPDPPTYTVVARRYRPQQFAELIGQEHVARALTNALQTGRVAHAYLFTGARGVGKTSAARILAKALNCEKGPNPTPCDRCASCLAIASGDDVDVLEIDGAVTTRSKRCATCGRASASVPRAAATRFTSSTKFTCSPRRHSTRCSRRWRSRPNTSSSSSRRRKCRRSRSRSCRGASGSISPTSGRAKSSTNSSGSSCGKGTRPTTTRCASLPAGPPARCATRNRCSINCSLPRRANSRREHVGALLGTAGDDRVIELATAILAGDAKTALDLIGAWVERGLQVGELVDQLVEYWRALMLVNCGGPDVRELPVTPNQNEAVKKHAPTVRLDAILGGLEVLTATKTRMRGSTHTQVLLEMAVVRLSCLAELRSVSELVQLAQALGASGVAVPVAAANAGTSAPSRPAPGSVAGPAARGGKKNDPPAVSLSRNGSQSAEQSGGLSTLSLTESTLRDVWERFLQHIGEKYLILAKHLSLASSYAISGPNSLVIRFPSAYRESRVACEAEASAQRIQDALKRVTGQAIAVRFESDASAAAHAVANGAARSAAPADRKRSLSSLPLFKKASEAAPERKSGM